MPIAEDGPTLAQEILEAVERTEGKGYNGMWMDWAVTLCTPGDLSSVP